MPLSRRTGNRFQGSIWPGFVDAMTGLLLVLMFVLTIFMVVQFVLRETISGQEDELDALGAEISALASALGLEERRGNQLEARLGALNATLNTAQDDLAEAQQELSQARQDITEQEALIASLTAQRERQDAALEAARGRITDFEAQVAALLAGQDRAADRIAGLEQARDALAAERDALAEARSALEGERDALLSEQEALNLALARSRTEIDQQTEAARLAAARAEALEALAEDLRRSRAEAEDRIASQSGRIGALEAELSEEEAARLAEAEAARALRARLAEADEELTAMTMALEDQRRRAEETLTMLAAAEAARDDLDERLTAALERAVQAEATVSDRTADRDALADRLEQVLTRIELLQQEAQETETVLRADLEEASAALDAAQGEAEARIAALQAQLEESRQGAEAARAALEARLAETQQDAEAARTALEADLAQSQAELAAARQAIDAAQRQASTVEERLLAALERLEAAQAAAADRDELQERMVAALAAQAEAEREASEQMTLAEQREALLATANRELEREEAASAEAQRKTELLNQQIAALRTQLGELQALLDDAEVREATAQVQLQSLGTQLNTALARAAAEERRRRRLEEAERIRLEEEARRLAEEAQDLEKYRSDFFGRLRDLVAQQEGVRIVGDRFVFSSEVLFAPAEAELSPEGRTEIAKVAGILRNIIDDIPEGIDWVLQVDGHTDNLPLSGLGQYRDNWELSQARALSVVRFMSDQLGIPPGRLSANGFGEYQPVNPADTPQARAQNRRIEIKLTEK